MPSRRTFAARLARGEYGGATTVEPSRSAIDLAELIAALPAASSVVAATAFPVLSGADAYQATAAQVLSYIAANASGTWGINITGTAPAGTLTGTTLAANVVTSSLTTIGTLVAGTVPAARVSAGTFQSGVYAFVAGSTADAFSITSTGLRQFRVAYDGSNYATISSSSTGNLTWNAVGSSGVTDFSDNGTIHLRAGDGGATAVGVFYVRPTIGSTGYLQMEVDGTTGATESYIPGGSAPIFGFNTYTVRFAAATTSRASARIQHGVAPSSPVNGDLWGVSAESLYYRNNGTTQYASWSRQAAIADASGGVVIDSEARTALNDLLAKLRTINVIAT